VAARGAVTAAEFNDLQTIAANLDTGLATSDYVASIFTQLVDGSLANQTWTAGAASSQLLGNLQVGTTGAQLGELIGKWFLGTDLPTATAEGATASSSISPTYQNFNYSLFGSTGGPVVSDIMQGDEGDCELCAGLIELVENNPGQIASMFVSEGSGIYGVRFYVNGKPTWVTVNGELPVYKGYLVFNGENASTFSNGFWVDLAEKAYAELSSDGNIGHPATNSYGNIASDAAVSIFTNLTNVSDVQYFYSNDSDWNAYKTLFITAIANHQDVVLESFGATKDSAGNQMLVNDHAFAVIGYDSATGDFIVRNPWGQIDASQGFDTQFEVSMADVVTVGGDFVVDNRANTDVAINNIASITSLAQTQSLPSITPTPQYLVKGVAVPVASLFQANDLAGLPITQYMLQVLSNASLALNGAANLASAAQTAQGEIVVSAADLAKVTLTPTATSGGIELLVTGNDGTGWSTPFDVYLGSTSANVAVASAFDTIVAPGATMPIAKLFSVSGSLATSGVYYQIVSDGDVGSINLNGAANLMTSPKAGQVMVSAADLGKLTYTANSTAGLGLLEVTIINGGQQSDTEQIPIDVGSSVAAALQTFNSGTVTFQLAIADSAANVFANLDALQTMVTPWDIIGITLTDATPQNETLGETQYLADRGVLAFIDNGGYQLTVTGTSLADAQTFLGNSQYHVSAVQIADNAANLFGNLDAVQSLVAAGQVSAISLTDGNAVSETITGRQYDKDAAALSLMTGNFTFAVNAISAADVGANLDQLQSQAAAGKLTSISLSDSGIGTVPLSAAQMTSDAQALAKITSYFAVAVNAAGANLTITGFTNHATTVDFSGTAASYSITPSGNGVSFTIGTDHLSNVTDLKFSDYTDFIASQTASGQVSSAQITSLYAAVFGRLPDAPGLNYYEAMASANPSLPITLYAEDFLSSPEYVNNSAHAYAQNSSGDSQFITDVYNNLLKRGPGSGDVAWYLANVVNPILGSAAPGTAAYASAELLAHATILADVSQSAEFLGDVQVTAAHPADATHWLILI